MESTKLVPIRQFSSLDDFIENNNNFWAHMMPDSANSKIGWWPCYKRFEKIAPELAAELRREHTFLKCTGENEKNIPWDKLWKAYKIMSQLVYEKDPYTGGEYNFNYLI